MRSNYHSQQTQIISDDRNAHNGYELVSVEDPWPTTEKALDAATVVATYARKLYGSILESVWLYVSRARNDHRADSDLDLLLIKKNKEDDPRNQLQYILYATILEVPYFEEYGPESLCYSSLGCWVSIHIGWSEQLREWDTMFYRSVRADAIKAT